MDTQPSGGNPERSSDRDTNSAITGASTLPCTFCGHPLDQHHPWWWANRERSDGQIMLFDLGIGGGKCTHEGCSCRAFWTA